MSDAGHSAVHDAIAALLDDDEIAVSWVLIIDVAGADGTRYLAHRAGSGGDGTAKPMVWTALGMLWASVLTAEDQLRDCTRDVEDEDDEDEQ